MKRFARPLFAAFSAGWIVPFCASHWLVSGFLSEVVVRAIASGEHWGGSWAPFALADQLFYFSMAWLAAVIFFWVLRRSPSNER